jgi:hypothetical protein
MEFLGEVKYSSFLAYNWDSGSRLRFFMKLSCRDSRDDAVSLMTRVEEFQLRPRSVAFEIFYELFDKNACRRTEEIRVVKTGQRLILRTNASKE